MESLWLSSSCFHLVKATASLQQTQAHASLHFSFHGVRWAKPSASITSPWSLLNPCHAVWTGSRDFMFLLPIRGDCTKPPSQSTRLLSARNCLLGGGRDAGRCLVVSSPSLTLICSSQACLGTADTSSTKMLPDLQKHHRKIARKQSSG